MKFIIEKNVFEKLPNLYIGVVIAKGINNDKEYPEIKKLLNDSVSIAKENFLDKKVKEDELIIPYREAFQKLDINPNKYMCSIEALFTRISKGKDLPNINPLVDLNNAVSLKYVLPMGTHDIDSCNEDIKLRFSNQNDTFIPFGSDEKEILEDNELIYVVGNEVRTRRWTWRQSDIGKIENNTNYVFFPIDGFKGINDDKVDDAIKFLENKLKEIFNCETTSGIVDINNNEIDLNI